MSEKSPVLTEKVVKSSGVVLVFTFLGAAFGYLIRLFYSNHLSIEMFGLFYAALAFFTLVSTYLDLGLGYSVIYFIPQFVKQQQLRKVTLIFQYYQIIQLIVTVVAAVSLFFSADFLAREYFKFSQAIGIIYVFSGYLVVNGMFSALNMAFVGLQKEVYYSSLQFLRLFLIFVFSLLFWFFGQNNVFFYTLAWFVSNLLIVIVYYVILSKKYSFLFQTFSWDQALFRTMLAYGLPTLITASLYIFITSIDAVFLTSLRNVAEVGVYNVVYPLATLAGLILTPINTLTLPLVSHLMVDEGHKVSHFIHSVLKLIPFVSLYFGLYIALFSGSLVSLLFGAKWVNLVELPLTIFALGYVFSPLASLLFTILSGMGKVKERLKLSIILVIFSAVSSLVLIALWGVVGAAIANSLVYLVSVVLFSKAISSSFVIRYPWSFYARLLLFAGLVATGIKLSHWLPVGLIQIVGSGLVYTLVFLLFGLHQQVLDQKLLLALKNIAATHFLKLKRFFG
jgi:O-antigen/teichoic acid export membrane protein